MGLLANELSPIAIPRAALAFATATSPWGCTACTPVGEIKTGIEIGWPITLVAISRVGGWPTVIGDNFNSANAAELSFIDRPRSDPAISAL